MLPPTKHVALVGLMGAGKSSVGRALAAALGRAFVDLDDAIIERAARSVAEIFAAEGEQGFRDRETAALTSALQSPVGMVIATGGGVVVRPANRDRLEEAFVVWLDTSVTELVRRVGRGQGRPLLAGAPRERLEELDRDRRPLYESCADLVVNTSGSSRGMVVAQITSALELLPERST